MKIWNVEFQPMYPVGGCLIIAAPDIETATKIAKETVKHTEIGVVSEVKTRKPCVIIYQSGDY